MDPLIYFLAEYFPWWSIPCILIFAEISNHYRRTGLRVRAALAALCSLLLLGLTIWWFTHSGFENLRPAMQNLEKTYGK